MKFFSLILLPFLTAISHGEIDKPDCPGIVVDGNTYIGAKDDLEPLSELYKYTYTAYCEFTDPPDDLNPTVKIASAYKCDFGILGNCQGYLVNSNYAFWDGHQFMDSHDQCHLITSCNQIPDVCDIRTDFSCDKGEYVCQPLHSSGSWCQGTVLSRTDPEPCPEQVTDCQELSFENCDCHINGGTEYWCYDDYRECRGKVVAPSPETKVPKPYISPEQRSDGTVLTLVNPEGVDTIASTKKSKNGNMTTLVAVGLLAGVAVVAYRRLRSKYMPSSSGGTGSAVEEYELGAYENSLTDDF